MSYFASVALCTQIFAIRDKHKNAILTKLTSCIRNQFSLLIDLVTTSTYFLWNRAIVYYKIETFITKYAPYSFVKKVSAIMRLGLETIAFSSNSTSFWKGGEQAQNCCQLTGEKSLYKHSTIRAQESFMQSLFCEVSNIPGRILSNVVDANL